MHACRLLVIDDDPMMAAISMATASGLGCQARVVSRVVDLMAAIKDWKPTHIAVDLVMPGVDGVEVLSLLARRRCKARIIVCSGLAGPILDAALRAASANGLDMAGVLPKPYSRSELQSLLQAPPLPDRGNGDSAASRSRMAEPSEADLRRALLKGEIFAVYTPKVDCITGDLIGLDTSARWRHSRAGVLTQDRFLPLAERLSLAEELTASLSGQAIAWVGATFPSDSLGLTLRILPTSLGNFQTIETLTKQCSLAALSPRSVTLQLSEAAAVSDSVRALEFLTRLRVQGFELSLGNVGAGYFSLRQLVRLPVSELEIDSSFAGEQSRESRVVAKCIVDLGASLRLRVTASGIDSVESLRYFSAIGVHYAMGDFIACPMDAKATEDWISGYRSSPNRPWQMALSP